MASWKTLDPAQKRYVIRTNLFMAGYAAVNIAAIFGAFDEIIGTSSGVVLGLAVAAPIAGQLWATLALMNEADEFVRALTAKRFVIASGLAMTGLSAWGFASTYGDWPQAPGWMIYPVFWGLYGLITPFVKSTGR